MGILGPSLDELAKKERIIKNNNKKIEKDINKKPIRVEKYVLIISISLFLMVVGSIIIINKVQPKPDYNNYSEQVDTYLNNQDGIASYKLDNNMAYIYVNDSWYLSGEIDKIRFCKNIRDSLTSIGMDNNIVNDNYIYTVFYDTTDIKVAEPNLSDYEILH